MKNVKVLTATILLGMGLMMGGCGNNQEMDAQNVPTQQTQKVDNGISLAKAVDLAKKGEFTPQTVKFEGNVIDKVFGDEPEIIVKTTFNMGGQYKFVNIHVTDPVVIQRVAKLQEERKNNFVHGTGSANINEIVITDNFIEVK